HTHLVEDRLHGLLAIDEGLELLRPRLAEKLDRLRAHRDFLLLGRALGGVHRPRRYRLAVDLERRYRAVALQQVLEAEVILHRAFAPEAHAGRSDAALRTRKLIHPLRRGRRRVAALLGIVDVEQPADAVLGRLGLVDRGLHVDRREQRNDTLGAVGADRVA